MVFLKFPRPYRLPTAFPSEFAKPRFDAESTENSLPADFGERRWAIGFWFTLSNYVAWIARSIFHRAPRLRVTFELAHHCFRNHFNDTVIVLCSETVAPGLHEL